jgi:hypothetical protein
LCALLFSLSSWERAGVRETTMAAALSILRGRVGAMVVSSMAQLTPVTARRSQRSGYGAVRTHVCASLPTN